MIFGARFGYCLLYEPNLLFQFQWSFPFWSFFNFSGGGLSVYGAFLAHLLFCFAFVKIFQSLPQPPTSSNRSVESPPLLHLLDVTTVMGAQGIFWVRIANYLNGEMLGKTTNLPWAIRFPHEVKYWIGNAFSPEKLKTLSAIFEEAHRQSPTQFISGQQWNLWILQLQEVISKNGLEASLNSEWAQKMRTQSFALLEHLPQASFSSEIINPFLVQLAPRHPTTLYQALGEGLVPFFICLFVIKKYHRSVGITAAVFTISYGLARALIEVWKMPDPLESVRSLSLAFSLSHWLSLAMIAVGVAMLSKIIFDSHRNSKSKK